MSNVEGYEEVTTTSDGVAVTKRYEADEFPVPAIAFEFESRRNEPVTVTLTDEVPTEVAVEDLGFHPEYGSEHWTIEDEAITFRRELEAGAEYTTVYGIRATGTDNVEQFLTAPALTEVEPPTDDESFLSVEEGEPVRDVIAGDADSVPGLDDEEEIETLDLKDPGEDSEPEVPEPSADDATTDDGPLEEAETDDRQNGATGAEGGLVAALAAELRAGEVAERDVEVLGRALAAVGDDDGADGSVEARVEKLQSDVSEVLAYADALEKFLDENGTGRQAVEGLRSEVEELRSEIDGIHGRVGGTREAVTALEERAEGNEERIEELAEDVDAAGNRAEEVEDDVSRFEEEVEERLDSLAEEVTTVRETVDDGEVDERLRTAERDIEELREWRDQLSSVIGGES